MASYDHLNIEVQAALERDMTIDITTTGRKSGELRRIEIWYLNIKGQIYITGSTGPRDWYANLVNKPELTFHLKESTAADLPATAEVVTDETERRRVFEAVTAKWYKDQEPLVDLVAEAPMVKVHFA
jgi:deazaflavin-dependent oxidoreductase (nitroreductase family)